MPRVPPDRPSRASAASSARLRAALRRLRRQLARRRRVERTFRAIVDRTNSIVLRWDPQGRIIFLNDHGLHLFGYRREEVEGRSVQGLIVPDTESSGRDLVHMIEDLLRHPEHYLANENENMCRDGRRVWITWRNTPVVDARGRLVEIISTGIDTTERKRAEEALRASEERFRALAVRDDLTGLYNTRHLYEGLAALLAASEAAGTGFALVFIDLDRFKRVVDAHGHLKGSRVIQEVAHVVHACLAPPAWAVAYAGDEFVVVLPGASKATALATAEEIRARIGATTYLGDVGPGVRITASVGVAAHPEDGRDLETLLALADQALFGVKRRGRNAVGAAPGRHAAAADR